MSARRLGYALATSVGLFGAAEALARLPGAWAERRALASIPAPDVARGLRLACAGDSVTWGFPAGPESAWPRVLAEADALAGVEVENLGLPGSAADAAFRRAHAWLAERPPPPTPTVVLFLAGINDCAHLRTDREVPVGALASVLRDGLSHLVTYRVLTQVVLRVRPTAGHSDLPSPFPGALAACRTKVRQGVAAAAQLRAPGKVGVAVLTYGAATEGVDDSGQSAWLATLVNDALRGEARAQEVPMVDTAACLAERGRAVLEAPLYVRDGLHLTTAGNRAMAACVGASLPEVLREL